MRLSQRLTQVPPYLFAQLDARKAAVVARGVDVIPLGIGDPDLSTPEPIIAEMRQAVGDPSNHRYPDYKGSLSFRQAAARYMLRRFGVTVDPERELLGLIGAKEGLAHLVWALVDPGDVTLCPDPGYPVYAVHTAFCGGFAYRMPLRAEHGFLPELSRIPTEIVERAKILFLNYPNNPTTAVADLEFFEEAVDFCRRYGIVLCHDNAYAEITYDGYHAPSVLEVQGAKDVAIEFHSLSKPFNMTGWRIGFACGNADAIEALGTVKNNTDSGPFTAVQVAAERALTQSEALVASQVSVYRRRRDRMVEALRAAGIAVQPPRGTIYLWCPVPEGETSEGFAGRLLEEAGVFVTPGTGYGQEGEGFFRISLTCSDDRLEEAARRIAALGSGG